MKIQTENVSVYYEKKQILSNITVDIEANKITALVGQSGCGKSTFLKSINRIIEEDGGKIQGNILLDGVDYTKLSKEQLRKKIGLVLQQPVVFPYSIEKNLSYVLKYHFKLTKSECREKIEEYLKDTKLYEEVKDTLQMSAKHLSGGQQQRLAIARSLCVDPEVLLLDEPCSALDMKNTIAIEEMLLELKKKYTIVIVTHNLAQAHRIADQVIFMDHGEIVEIADNKTFFGNPGTQLAKEYIQYM